MVYLLAVVIAALYLGRGPAILASIASVLAFDFFFIPPQLTFSVQDTEYVLTFAAFMLVGLVISYLAVQAREQAEFAQRRAEDTTALYALTRDLASANTLDEVLKALIINLEEAFGRDAVIYLPEVDDSLYPYTRGPVVPMDELEVAVATWAYQHGEPAGRGTDTLPAAQVRYIPLKTAERKLGVLGVKPKDETTHLTPDQRRLLEAFASQAALAIEHVQLAEQAQNAEVLQATEKLQTALLNSISHDLRTPLVSITGALTSLQDSNVVLQDDIVISLIETAREEVRDRLNRLVGNLLSMTRLEGGGDECVRRRVTSRMRLVQPWSTKDRLSNSPGDRQVKITVPEDFPLVPMDFALIVQVLVNVIDNAIKYSPAGSTIEISAQVSGSWANITVADQGIGIPT